MTQGSEKRARDRHITIRLTADERARIDADAERAGLTSGSYARRTLLGADTPRQIRRPPVERKELARLLGELGHIDLHQLPRDMFLAPPPATAYVISLLDSCSRLAWAEVVTSKKALPVTTRLGQKTAPSEWPSNRCWTAAGLPCCEEAAQWCRLHAEKPCHHQA